MAIDEPLDAVQAGIEADERAASPINRFITPVAEALSLIPGVDIGVQALTKAAARVLQHREQARSEDLVFVLVDEMKRVNAKLPRIEQLEQDRLQFQREFPDLLLDGLRKAEQTRARDRIVRLGKILGHAYQEGPRKSFDLAEELMRVATLLDGQDIRVLAWVCEGLRPHYTSQTGQVDHEHTNNFWGQVDSHGRTQSAGNPALPDQMSMGDVLTCCAKLQAFGLLVQVRQNSNKVAPSVLPYAPLKRGYEFLDYIGGATMS